MWLSSNNRLLHGLGRTLLQVLRQLMAFGHRIRAHDLTGLEPLLEPPEIVGQLRREIVAADLRRERADLAERRILRPLDHDLRAAAAGSVGIPDHRAVLLHLLPELVVDRLLD